MKISILVSLLAICFASTEARHLRHAKEAKNFMAKGNNELTVNLLQSESKNEENTVFSPVGYSSILALLAEGAREETRRQLSKALNHPDNIDVVRSVYKNVLSGMKEHGVLNQPELKGWFYVYKNNSIDEKYKSVLKENYFIDIKEVDRYSNTDDDHNEKAVVKISSDPVADEPEQNVIPKEDEETEVKTETNFATSSNEMSETTPAQEVTMEEATTEAFQKNQVDAKWETPEIGSPRSGRMDLEDIIARSLKYEIQSTKEMVSALSANRLSAMGPNAKPSSRMIVFNALYFRGNWSVPMKLSSEKIKFSNSGTEQFVNGIEGEGQLAVGQIPKLDATAIDLPYQGDKFSMTILLPNRIGGLEELINNLSGFSFWNIDQHLTKQSVRVLMPKFQFYTISKPKEALVKSGVNDIFEDTADLSGITGTTDLYLDDLIQLVTLDVDENQSSNVQLTAGIVSEMRSSQTSFTVDHPFLFFIRDKENDIVVVAGAVKKPHTTHDL